MTPPRPVDVEAVEAQRRRTAAGIATMRRETPDREARVVSGWVRASSVGIDEPDET